MRSQIFIFTLLSLIILSCSKDQSVDTKSYTEIPADLTGSWNWLYSSGGFAGVIITPQTTGEVRKIEFDTNNNFRYFVNGELKSESKFHIEKSKSIFSTDSAFILIMDSRSLRQSIRFHHSDTLTLSEEVYDGYGHQYKRIK